MNHQNPWSTEVTHIKTDEIKVRGISIAKLIKEFSFVETFWFLLTGKRPDKKQSRIIEAILVAMCDHGPTPPSTQTARLVASSGSPIHTAIAAGLLAFGDHHAGAIENAMKMWQQTVENDIISGNLTVEKAALKLVKSYLSKGKRIPGFGHRYHRRDPRAPALIEMAKDLAVDGLHLHLAIAVEKLLSKQKGIYMNIDGVSSAILSDLGLHWKAGRGVFATGRIPGLLVEVLVELTAYKPFRKMLSTETDEK